MLPFKSVMLRMLALGKTTLGVLRTFSGRPYCSYCNDSFPSKSPEFHWHFQEVIITFSRTVL